MVLCNHHYYLVSELFHHPKWKPHSYKDSFHIPPFKTTNLCLAVWIYFCTFYTNAIIHIVSGFFHLAQCFLFY